MKQILLFALLLLPALGWGQFISYNLITERATFDAAAPDSYRSPWQYSRADSTLYRWNYTTLAWESVEASFGLASTTYADNAAATAAAGVATLLNATSAFTLQDTLTITSAGANYNTRFLLGGFAPYTDSFVGADEVYGWFTKNGNIESFMGIWYGGHYIHVENNTTGVAGSIVNESGVIQIRQTPVGSAMLINGINFNSADGLELRSDSLYVGTAAGGVRIVYPNTPPVGNGYVWTTNTNGTFEWVDPATLGGGGSFTFDVSDGGAQVETVVSSDEIAFTGATVSKGGGIITVDIPAGTDDQTIDTLTFDGTTLNASLESDGEAAQTVDLSSLQEPTDGDKTDITVSASGATWAIDDNTVGDAELASTAVTAGLYTNGLSVNVNEDGRIEGISFSAVAMTGLASAVQDSITIGRAAVFNDAPAGSTQTISINNKTVGIFQIDYTGASSPLTLTVNNPVDGGVYTFHHRNVTSQDVVYPAAFYNADGTSLGTVTYTADDFLTCYYDGSDYYCK